MIRPLAWARAKNLLMALDIKDLISNDAGMTNSGAGFVQSATFEPLPGQAFRYPGDGTV